MIVRFRSGSSAAIVGAWGALALILGGAIAAPPAARGPAAQGPAAQGPAARGPAAAKKGAVDEAAAVDVFTAMKAGQVTVKFIPENEHKANIIVENKTKQALTVKLPDAFAGMPVLSQAPGGDAGQAAGGAGGPALNIPPEKTRKIEVPTLCLEHGKRDPTPKMAYELRPLEDFSKKPEVKALLVRYGRGDINTKVAQAAAWHLQNGMSWQELAAKELKHARRASEPYFTAAELAQAVKLTKFAQDQAQATADPTASSDGNK